MSRIAYVNGRYLPMGRAQVGIEDRGYQFADGVYEVIAVRAGGLVDADRHYQRLERSLGELRIARPMGRGALDHVLHETVRRNRVEDGIVYLQVTRGVARRDHPFPKSVRPSLVVTSRAGLWHSQKLAETGVGVITLAELRWRRCDIKSIALLPNVLAKQQAREAGAYEAWFVDPAGFVTEGSSTNAWILDGAGQLVTRPLDHAILPGVTRLALLDLAEDAGIAVVERPFTLAEARAAKEAFLSSTTTFFLPVVRLDGQPVGDGQPGPVARRLRLLYLRYMDEDVGA